MAGVSTMGKIKPVYLSTKDHDIVEFISRIGNFSEWVKTRIRQEIEPDNSITALIEKIVSQKMAGCTVTVPKIEIKEAGDDWW